MARSSESGGPNGAHIHGTDVPMGEPSTASTADVTCWKDGQLMDSKRSSLGRLSIQIKSANRRITLPSVRALIFSDRR
jgi:hypothetical protein